MTRRWAPILVGSVVVLGLVATARVPEAGVGWRLAFVSLHALGFGALVLYLHRSVISMSQLIGVAIVLRLVALPMLPTLSDDGYRYLWDGLVAQEADISPYDLRPSDPALSAWQSEPLYPAMNSPEYYSVYPPASQGLFRVTALAYRPFGWMASWWLLKGLLVGFELVGILALARVAGPTRTAVYAWSPLAVVEIAGQGHTEALVVAGLGAMLWAGRSRIPWGSISATVGGLAKLYPLALLPIAWRREGMAGMLTSLGLGVVLTLPVWSPGAVGHVSESLGLFMGTLDEYAAPYLALKAALHPLVGEAAGRWASVALSSVFVGAAMAAVAVDDGTQRGVRIALVLVVTGFTLTASTLHPWYWLPLLFLYPLLRGHWVLWIAATSSIGYFGYVVPPASLVALMLGWGGACAFLFLDRSASPSLRPRGDLRQQG